ncbi:threonine synthase [Cryobacterium mesophilum]|uniref:Threonine synthase n=1 Tax=Terrimesophilobacter mesophilus TaxID=433647 RepID=A0A4R8VD22_9MICO|nr:threonine synthase [Terrimesophilobacter mesophilus]MBB5633963.1 threonine synthase [Terrimesophilobacter mesophilus]TFB80625.1 threonine synthase [Terrimesophilobacter mesophilus]
MSELSTSRQWRGVIREYADRLDVTESTPVVTLGEGGTPLIEAHPLSERTGARVWIKVEGMNPTGSFKDRGMTMAVTKAVERGAKVVVCASTGNTSASAAAYATRAGITAAVLVPEGKIAIGKLSQAIAHNARLLQVQGNFDDCLDIARELAANYPVHLVNSVNNDRIEGQKTAAFEVVEVLGDAPDYHLLPLGNAGNYTAYHRGYREEITRNAATRLPRMFGFQAEGSAPIVRGHVVTDPETIASAIRIGNPASWELALVARDDSDGYFGMFSDAKILEAHRILSADVGIFVEPASAIGVAGLLERAEAGMIPKGSTVVITVTGHGLKDPQWAVRRPDGSDVTPTVVPVDAAEVAEALGLGAAAAGGSASAGPSSGGTDPASPA